MRFEFIHFADAHVGTEQYHNASRYKDFARSYLEVVQRAIDLRVKFVFIAGDLFNSDEIWAMTHDQVYTGLRMLRQAGISVVAVRGNHEKLRGTNRDYLWLQSLARRNLLILLDVETGAEGGVSLKPWDTESHRGGYWDGDGVRIVGLGWQGAQTAAAIKGLAEELARLPREGIEYTVLVAHAGMQGYLPNNLEGGLTSEQVAPLEPLVDYLALGHIHLAYQVNRTLPDGTSYPWIFNPGSLDTCAINEWGWERGYYYVEVDTNAQPKHRAELRKLASLRPVVSATVKVTELFNPQALQEAVKTALLAELEKQRPQSKPIAHVRLIGTLRFDRAALDFSLLEELVKECCDPLVVLIKDHTSSSCPVDGPIEQEWDPAKLELDTFKDAWASDVRYRERALALAQLTREVKQLLLAETGADGVAAIIRQRYEELMAGPSPSSGDSVGVLAQRAETAGGPAR